MGGASEIGENALLLHCNLHRNLPHVDCTGWPCLMPLRPLSLTWLWLQRLCVLSGSPFTLLWRYVAPPCSQVSCEGELCMRVKCADQMVATRVTMNTMGDAARVAYIRP